MTVCCPAQSFAGRAGVVARLEGVDSEVDKWPVRAAVASVRDKGLAWLALQLVGCRKADLACMRSSAEGLDLGHVEVRD